MHHMRIQSAMNTKNDIPSEVSSSTHNGSEEFNIKDWRMVDSGYSDHLNPSLSLTIVSQNE